MRGSSLILNAGPSTFIVLVKFGAQLFGVVHHRTELVERKLRPPKPQRVCRNSTSPGDVMRIAAAIAASTGASSTSEKAATTTSKTRLKNRSKFALRRAGQAEQWDVVEILQVNARICLRQKLQLHADLNADVGAVRHQRLQSRQLLHVNGEYHLVNDPDPAGRCSIRAGGKNLVMAEPVVRASTRRCWDPRSRPDEDPCRGSPR